MRFVVLVGLLMFTMTAKADHYIKTKNGWVKVVNSPADTAVEPAKVNGPIKGLAQSLGKAAQFVVNKDERAYKHALKEAQILAARGTAGHPLGCAPGTRYSGTGYSWSARPNHCFYGEMSESRLVARACVRGANGAYFWSAHYR